MMCCCGLMEKTILGKVQCPNCMQWSQDGHLLIHTQTEVQILLPKLSNDMESVGWMILKPTKPMSSSAYQIDRSSVSSWLHKSWQPDSSIPRYILTCVTNCDQFVSLFAMLLSDGFVVIVQLNSLLLLEDEGLEEFDAFGISITKNLSSFDMRRDVTFAQTAAICSLCWSRSIDIFLDNEGDGSSHQHIKQRAQILVTGNISGVVEVWGLYHPFEIYLLSGRSPSASLLLLSLPLSSIFAAISNIKHENVYNTSLDCQVSTLLRLTSITSVSHSSTSSISLILGLSNGMLLRIDLQLSGTPADYNWELLWSRQIFNCSIDGVSVLEVGSCTTLFVVSGQLGTLIPFNRITCSETPHLMNNVVNSGYISYWNHYILSGDTITSFSVVNLPRQLDLSLLEGIEGISLPSHSFSKYCHYVLISSLDGIIRLIPVSGTDTDSNDSIVLFQTTFQISGLSVDPLGLSYSFLVNSNESTAKRYYQAKAHNIIFQPLPWCPIVSLADRPYLESLISSIVNDSSKASCSLTTLYSLISHLLLEFNTMSEAAYQKECFLHPEYRADAHSLEGESRMHNFIETLIVVCTSISNRFLFNKKTVGKAAAPSFFPIHHFPQDAESHFQKFRLWQCLLGSILSIRNYSPPSMFPEESELLENILRECVRVSWLRHYIQCAYEYFSVAILDDRIKATDNSTTDHLEPVPPYDILKSWFRLYPTPTSEECYSIYLASQYLHQYLHKYCTIDVKKYYESPTEPFSFEEVAYLMSLSISLQVYCERIRLISYSSEHPDPYAFTCQYCGSYEAQQDITLKRVCSSCNIATDICIRTCLPINGAGQRVVLRCPNCRSCVDQTLSFMTFFTHEFPSSLTMCLFCSIPLTRT